MKPDTTHPRGFLDWADPALVHRARESGGDVTGALALARELGRTAAGPGTSSWPWLRMLGSLGAGDLTVARVVEPHLDALAILAQASTIGDDSPQGLGALRTDPDHTWGVYAAHSPQHHLTARATESGWLLAGTKPWCSLAGRVSHAIITASVDDSRQAFAVDLADAGMRVLEEPWVARGLTAIPSTAIELDDVAAVPVGAPDWYLQRPGFAWGGIGVAAVWFGAACALAQTVLDAAHRRAPDQVALVHLGRLDLALRACELALRDAAQRIDAGQAAGIAGALLAVRTRSLVASAAEAAISETGRALGPAPLTADEQHARRVADLTVYVRQHHGDRDLAQLGSMLVEQGP